MRVRTIAGLTSVLALTAFGVGSAAVGAGAGTRSGTEHVVIITTSPTQSTSMTQFFGPIVGTGQDHQLSNNTDRFVLKNGTFLVDHHVTNQTQNQDRKNCVFEQIQQGRYTIRGGTGAYKNVHGNGTFEAHILAQGCSMKAPPTELSAIVEAAGPITLG